MSAVDLAKIPLLFLNAWALWRTSSPPNAPRPREEHIVPGWREEFVRMLGRPAVLYRTFYWIMGVVEVAFILIRYVDPENPLLHLLRGRELGIADDDSVAITPTFLLGTLIALFGVLRVWCYRTLGKFFTFELAIVRSGPNVPRHKLVTSGPYAYVRHPSYTGMVVRVLGAWLCINSPNSGSWFIGSGLGSTLPGRVANWFVGTVGALICVAVVLRVRVEDELLRKEFGREWEAWKGRVRWAMVPGIY
ncbi:hypothetical protein CPC08DRAFT_796687 [Agrocybe pediades]|nr:hypothetical protein CPC08DRAFT_796687 [Agrocybe pediades]